LLVKADRPRGASAGAVRASALTRAESRGGELERGVGGLDLLELGALLAGRLEAAGLGCTFMVGSPPDSRLLGNGPPRGGVFVANLLPDVNPMLTLVSKG